MEELSQKLESLINDLGLLGSEYALIGTIILALVADLLFSNKRITDSVVIIGLLTSIYLSIEAFVGFSSSKFLFQNMLILSQAALFWKIVLALSTFFCLLLFISGKSIFRRAEATILILTLLLASNFLVMSSNLLMVYFCVEIISISSYILAYFSFDKKGTEAALKYLLFGATSAAVMLYGLSLLFAITGTLDFTSQQFVDSLLAAEALPLIITSILVIAGLLFKIAAVPFHIWSPDVYTAAPTPIVALFSVVPKVAGVAIFIKIVLALNLFGQSPINWPVMISIIAMATITLGNFSALWQANFKRMMAYSSIAQTGFLLAAIAAFSELGLSSLSFYVIVFALANIAVFALIQFFEKNYQITEVSEYAGLIKRHPLVCILLLTALLSLTGLPPTSGFTGKFLIFGALWDSYSTTGNNWLLTLLIFGLLNTVVSLFYYLKVPYFMIFKEGKSSEKKHQILFGSENYLATLLVVAILLFFFRPDWLMGWINNINFAF
ncbi:NADH-quinone oxidoreductase subunit N [Fulvivirga lutea]|uniref:NADH-quinone oxidoreductase subunit N n=1 Tax=Fulvivirga lutea TaxID=2810512 RepID=A0A974WEK2_9BACT|nr:NADH-quinone oxidoreductase subunit N [Fulvivirga lutea]QSE95948.1 NADH-quinone oxidoreductase subunit N [Fulvivirga lutea]